MLVFFLITIFIIIITLILSTITLNIKDVKLSNFKNIESNSNVYIQIIIFKIIRISLAKIDIKKIYQNKKMDFNKIMNFEKDKKMKKLIFNKIKLEKIDFRLAIGTGNIILTTYAITILSIILSCILPLYITRSLKNSYYKITPIYDEELKYEIGLNCIISIKMVHIIHIIYLILKKRRDEKYARTSNRRAYEGSYE